MRRRVLYLALAVFIVLGCGIGLLVYRRDAETLKAELARLQRINSQLSSHDKAIGQYSTKMIALEKHAQAAAQRRHDSAISANNNPVFETHQADIEKADVAELGAIIVKVRGEHAAKAAILSPIFGDEAVAPYRDCEATADEELANYGDDWTNAIETIDDDDHIIINGGEHSDSVDAQSGTFYASSAKSLEAYIGQVVKCAAAYDGLQNRLMTDIQSTKQKLTGLGVKTN